MNSPPCSPSCEPRPFLKWAGGKRQLLAQLRRFYPASFARYYEPFVGSGAVFFDLAATGRLRDVPVVLSDGNADLVGTYLRVCDRTDEVIAALERLALGHEQRGRAHYYDVRDVRFNPAREAWRASGEDPQTYPAELAAMLIYLNRTGFNGLFRLNASGHFNVPAGRYTRPRILQAARLRCAAATLATRQVSIRVSPFEEAARNARAGDLVYFDPPYAPLSATASFRAYTARGFGHDAQQRLRDLAIALARSGVSVILSNSTAPDVMALYEGPEAARAGLHTWRVPARRAINSRADRRGAVEELIVSNVVPGEPAQG